MSGIESSTPLSSTLISKDVDVAPPLLQLCGQTLDAMRHFFMRRMDAATETFERAASLKHCAISMPIVILCVFYQCLALLQGCPKFAVPVHSNLVADALSPNSALPSVMPPGYDAQVVLRRLAQADALIQQMVAASTHSARILHDIETLRV